MPSPEKDRPSGRRLGRLLDALRPSRAGPLPVQTGFPTSLADLVVKNHGRLKKQPSPSSKRKKGVPSASPSPSPSLSPPPSSPPPPPPPPAVTVSPPRPDISPARPLRREKSGAFGLGLGFLAFAGVVSLALLVIWSKKVVAAVTVAAFSLFLLDSLRCSALPRRRLRSAATERHLYLDGRGRVSPIRELEAETEPSRRLSFTDSDRGFEVAVSVDSSEEKSGGVLDESSNSKGKTKRRSWKKLIASAKKLHRGRKSNKNAEDRSGSFRSEGGRSDATVSGNLRVEDFSGSRRGVACEADAMSDAAIADELDSLGSRRRRSSEILVVDDARADLTTEEQETEGQQCRAGIRFPALVLVAVVLVGLVAGKLLAVAFTVLCAAFFSSVPRFPCRGDEGPRQGIAVEAPIGGAPRVGVVVN